MPQIKHTKQNYTKNNPPPPPSSHKKKNKNKKQKQNKKKKKKTKKKKKKKKKHETSDAWETRYVSYFSSSLQRMSILLFRNASVKRC